MTRCLSQLLLGAKEVGDDDGDDGSGDDDDAAPPGGTVVTPAKTSTVRWLLLQQTTDGWGCLADGTAGRQYRYYWHITD